MSEGYDLDGLKKGPGTKRKSNKEEDPSKKAEKEKLEAEKKKKKKKKKPAVKFTQEKSAFQAANDDSEGDSSLWLITFTDVMALMLTFFVLLYAMSQPQEEAWTEITASFNEQFGETYSAKFEEGRQDAITIDRVDFAEALDLGYLKTLLSQIIEKDENLQDIVLIHQDKRLVISLPQDLLFASGQADVQGRGRRALFVLGGALARIKNRIEVLGHADPTPINNPEGDYPTNWELSLARANAVAGVLRNVGYQRPMTVRGLSSSRYTELPDSLTEEERLSLSRRVDIALTRDDGSKVTLFNLPGM